LNEGTPPMQYEFNSRSQNNQLVLHSDAAAINSEL